MVHVTKNVNGEELSGNIESTLGRLIFMRFSLRIRIC